MQFGSANRWASKALPRVYLKHESEFTGRGILYRATSALLARKRSRSASASDVVAEFMRVVRHGNSSFLPLMLAIKPICCRLQCPVAHQTLLMRLSGSDSMFARSPVTSILPGPSDCRNNRRGPDAEGEVQPGWAVHLFICVIFLWFYTQNAERAEYCNERLTRQKRFKEKIHFS